MTGFLVLVLSLLAVCFCIMNAYWVVLRNFRRDAIERGFAQYDPKSGKWGWK